MLVEQGCRLVGQDRGRFWTQRPWDSFNFWCTILKILPLFSLFFYFHYNHFAFRNYNLFVYDSAEWCKRIPIATSLVVVCFYLFGKSLIPLKTSIKCLTCCLVLFFTLYHYRSLDFLRCVKIFYIFHPGISSEIDFLYSLRVPLDIKHSETEPNGFLCTSLWCIYPSILSDWPTFLKR